MWTAGSGPADPDDDVQPPDELVAAMAPPPDERLVVAQPDDDASLYTTEVADPDGEAPSIADALIELAAIAAVDELESGEAVLDVAELASGGCLDRLSSTASRVNAALVDQVRLVAHWADLHGAVRSSMIPGAERLVTLGGEGTPRVGEFCVAELGVGLAMTTDQAARLLGDVLDLRHRLPLLWAQVLAGDVPVPLARRVAGETRELSAERASRVDARVAALAGKLTWRRLARIIRAAILAAAPYEALEEAEQAKGETGVWVDDEESLRDGYGRLTARAAAGDLAAFNAAIAQIAAALEILGDSDPLQQRRSKAIGFLARPQAAIDLLEQANLVLENTKDPGSTRRRRLAFDHVLYFHLSRESVAAMRAGRPGGVGRLEGAGAVLAEQIADWLGHRNVVVKPIIDPDRIPAVDCWEIPARMREAVAATRPADYFPWSSCVTRGQDTDHVRAYLPPNRGGPPGQTSTANLARLTRRHHRVKTHAGWTVTSIRDDTWLWRSPSGHFTLVDNTGAVSLGRL